MNNEIKRHTKGFSIICWNIGNPSKERAAKQAEWLRKRTENVIILTETKLSKGCLFLERYFQAFGYNVFYPKPVGNEYGVMIISKNHLTESTFSNSINNLKSRVASIKLKLGGEELEIIGVYVPSRDSSSGKIEKKKFFLNNLNDTFKLYSLTKKRIVCGDLNILEPNHVPHYPFFKDWEYDFYSCLIKYHLEDSFRYLNPRIHEYSWIGRNGDGYRYDHCFVSLDLLPLLKKCFYLHEPRESRLSDHSALITIFAIGER